MDLSLCSEGLKASSICFPSIGVAVADFSQWRHPNSQTLDQKCQSLESWAFSGLVLGKSNLRLGARQTLADVQSVVLCACICLSLHEPERLSRYSRENVWTSVDILHWDSQGDYSRYESTVADVATRPVFNPVLVSVTGMPLIDCLDYFALFQPVLTDEELLQQIVFKHVFWTANRLTDWYPVRR